MDGFRTIVVCCLRSETEVCSFLSIAVIKTDAFVISQDLVTALPEKYVFDLGKSTDVFWLRRCMRNAWKLAHEIKDWIGLLMFK